jgi:hypothetical protein
MLRSNHAAGSALVLLDEIGGDRSGGGLGAEGSADGTAAARARVVATTFTTAGEARYTTPVSSAA